MLAGSTLLASDSSSAGAVPKGGSGTAVLNYTSGAAEDLAAGNLRIRLVDLSQVDPEHPGADWEVDFDDVQLEAVAIPEPSTLALLAAALAWAGVWGKRSRRGQKPPGPGLPSMR